MSSIEYKIDVIPDTDSIIKVYASSGLNRPIDNKDRIASMYQNSNLVVTAWQNDILVGVSRALTDFRYCCYLSDLAVSSEYQKKGIGKKLIDLTKERIGDEVMLLLLSSPDAMGYYPKVGFDTVDNGFIIKRKK